MLSEGALLRDFLRFSMPRGVFRVVLDLLMPSWDPLRRRSDGVQQPQGECNGREEASGGDRREGRSRNEHAGKINGNME